MVPAGFSAPSQTPYSKMGFIHLYNYFVTREEELR
jgi:hypothetical protein